jgi:hypothetical protein
MVNLQEDQLELVELVAEEQEVEVDLQLKQQVQEQPTLVVVEVVVDTIQHQDQIL